MASFIANENVAITTAAASGAAEASQPADTPAASQSATTPAAEVSRPAAAPAAEASTPAATPAAEAAEASPPATATTPAAEASTSATTPAAEASALAAAPTAEVTTPAAAPAAEASTPAAVTVTADSPPANGAVASVPQAKDDKFEAPTTQITRSGASQEMTQTLLNICDTYLGGSRPKHLEATIHSANSKYAEGSLTPKQLAEFHCRIYTAMCFNHDNGNALVAWISSEERAQSHWSKLGHASYEAYLKEIDPSGKVMTMITLHKQTTRRKNNAADTVQRCWTGSPELLELASREESESRWRALAGLAKATENAPEVAKFCLNKTLLERIRCNRDGRRATKAFLVPDFIEAKKMAETINRTTCPWDTETYANASQYGLKVYRGVMMSTVKHHGLVDPPRVVTNVNLPGDTTPPPMPALAPASATNNVTQQLTMEGLAAIDAARPPPMPCQTTRPQSSSGSESSESSLSSIPSGTLTPSPRPPRSGTPIREGGATLPPTPPTLPRPRQTGEDSEVDSTPSPSSTTIDLGLTERAQQQMVSTAELLVELSGASGRQWTEAQEMCLQGNLDWLLKDDSEVVAMLRNEHDLHRHYHKREHWEIRTSLAHQAARQDPGLYALAVACLGTGNHRLVTCPCEGEGAIVAEVHLNGPVGDLRIAAQPTAPQGRRLVVEWSALSDNGKSVIGKQRTSWGRYSLSHSTWEDDARGITGRLRSVNSLGAALLCRISWDNPSVLRNCSILFSKDRKAAQAFIQNSRQGILSQLKLAYRELERTERFWYGKKRSFFAAQNLKRPADNANNGSQPDKRARLAE